MRVIITGGSGLIGRALTENLAQDGHEVIILSRNPAKVSGLPTGAQAVAWDASTSAGWGSLVEGSHAVVNLAGESLKGTGFLPNRWTQRRKKEVRQSCLDAGAAVVQAVQAASHRPQVVVQASAVGFYGPLGVEAATEQAGPPGQDFLAGVCAGWEASTAGVEAMGVRRVIARTGLPLSLKGGAFPLLLLPFRLFTGNTFGSGRQYYPWIHFDDHVAALRFLIDSPQASGPYNLSAPNPATNREFAHTLGRVMRRPTWLPVPRFALQLALGEVSTVVMDGQRAVPEKLMKEGFKFGFPNLEPALKDLLGK